MSELSLEERDRRNRYKNGAELAHDKWVEKKWTNISQAYCDLARDVLRYRTRKSKHWIFPESWRRFDERSGLEKKLIGVRSVRLRAKLQEDYGKKYLELKKRMRKREREWANNIGQDAEDAAKREQTKEAVP